MRVKRFLIHKVEDKLKEVYPLSVPMGSIFLKIKMLSEGIFCWFAVPEGIESMEEHTFYLIKTNTDIPENSEYIDILDFTIQAPTGQEAVVILPVFKSKIVLK